jgi:hypothetical protein
MKFKSATRRKESRPAYEGSEKKDPNFFISNPFFQESKKSEK